MSDGRTLWWAKDASWWRRERIVILGEKHGPAGPAVIDWLSCEAKLQNQGGWVKAGYTALARGAFLSRSVTARHVVSHAFELGLLDDLENDEWTFTARISGWRADQEKGRAAARKAKERGQTSPASHGLSRSVTESHVAVITGQDRTEETTGEPPLDAVVEEPQTTVARDPEHERLSQLLASLIRQRDQNAKVAPASKAWLDAIRLLIDRDHRTPADIERVIRWCQADTFWQANILSAPKLRAQFDQLYARTLASRAPAAAADAQVVEWLDRTPEYEALRRHA